MRGSTALRYGSIRKAHFSFLEVLDLEFYSDLKNALEASFAHAVPWHAAPPAIRTFAPCRAGLAMALETIYIYFCSTTRLYATQRRVSTVKLNNSVFFNADS